jgi:hypothetical protein
MTLKLREALGSLNPKPSQQKPTVLLKFMLLQSKQPWIDSEASVF